MRLSTRSRFVLLGLATVAATATVTMASGTALAAQPEGVVHDAGTGSVVQNSFVVVVKNGVNASAGDLTARYGGKVTRTYGSALHGFAVDAMSEAQARRLAADPAIAYVQRNGVYRISGTQTNPPSWGLDRIDQRNLPLDNSYTYPSTASSVHAYIIDTGIRFSHQDFQGRAVSGRDTVDNDNDATDCNGHGTHVSGTVGGASYGVARQRHQTGRGQHEPRRWR